MFYLVRGGTCSNLKNLYRGLQQSWELVSKNFAAPDGWSKHAIEMFLIGCRYFCRILFYPKYGFFSVSYFCVSSSSKKSACACYHNTIAWASSTKLWHDFCSRNFNLRSPEINCLIWTRVLQDMLCTSYFYMVVQI